MTSDTMPRAPRDSAHSTCLFCRIARGELKAEIVVATDDAVAFLDHRPLFPGHCLVVPRAHIETLGDLPASQFAPLFGLAQRIAIAVEKGLRADGSFVAMNNRVSQSVPHLHVHVVPRKKKDGLRGFFWPRQKYASDEDAVRTRDAICSALP